MRGAHPAAHHHRARLIITANQTKGKGQESFNTTTASEPCSMHGKARKGGRGRESNILDDLASLLGDPPLGRRTSTGQNRVAVSFSQLFCASSKGVANLLEPSSVPSGFSFFCSFFAPPFISSLNTTPQQHFSQQNVCIVFMLREQCKNACLGRWNFALGLGDLRFRPLLSPRCKPCARTPSPPLTTHPISICSRQPRSVSIFLVWWGYRLLF